MTTEIANRPVTLLMTHNETQFLGPQERLKHRAMIGVEVEAMLDGYWQNRPAEPVRDRILANWMDELERYTLEEIRTACVQWQRGNPNKKPNHGHISEALRSARAGACMPFIERMVAICRDVSERHGLPEWILRSKDRGRRTCDARAEAVWLCREADISTSVIGEFFGRDHSTISNALERHKQNMESTNV